MTADQLALFDDRTGALLAWRAKFDRAPWVAPYDTASGLSKGAVLNGWRCPDPECGQVEPNSFVLSINHGFDPDVEGRQRFDGRCQRRPLLRHQAEVTGPRKLEA